MVTTTRDIGARLSKLALYYYCIPRDSLRILLSLAGRSAWSPTRSSPGLSAERLRCTRHCSQTCGTFVYLHRRHRWNSIISPHIPETAADGVGERRCMSAATSSSNFARYSLRIDIGIGTVASVTLHHSVGILNGSENYSSVRNTRSVDSCLSLKWFVGETVNCFFFSFCFIELSFRRDKNQMRLVSVWNENDDKNTVQFILIRLVMPPRPHPLFLLRYENCLYAGFGNSCNYC